jgi:hypothetical protein
MHVELDEMVRMVSPYRPESFDGIIKNKLPGKLFFFFDPSDVPLYRTHVLCTKGRRNISLIGRTAVGSLSVFEWPHKSQKWIYKIKTLQIEQFIVSNLTLNVSQIR